MQALVKQSNQLGDKFVINLIAQADGTYEVRSVELLDEGKRLRFSFTKSHAVRDVFSPKAAAMLLEIAQKARRQPGLLALPDFKVNLGTLSFDGCRVMVTAAETGTENVMIRWRSYYGKVVNFFKDSFSYRDCIVENATEHALEMMQEVYLPLFDISRFIDAMNDNPDSNDTRNVSVALNELNRRIKDLRYYEFLMKRYVAMQGEQTRALDHDPVSRDHRSIDMQTALPAARFGSTS